MRQRLLILTAVALIYVGWRFAYAQIFLREAYAADGQTRELDIVLTDYPRESAYGWQVDGRALGVAATVYLDVSKENGTLKPGDRISGAFRLKAGYAYGKHLTASQSGSTAVFPADTVPWRYKPAQWAKAICERLDSLFPDTQAALVRGLLTGDKSGFDEKLRDDLFAVGMSHIASVSGLHISMLAGFVLLIVRNRAWAAAIGLPVILIYIAVAGFPLSAQRAGLMYAIMLTAPLLMREYRPLRALLAAAAFILLLQPYAIQDAGFLLSVASTLGLILFSNPIRLRVLGVFGRVRCLKSLPEKLKRTVSAAIGASAAVLVFSTPVAAVAFDGVSLIAPICNAMLLWMVTGAFFVSAVALGLTFVWWPAAYITALPARWLITGFLWLVDKLARIPFAVMYTSNVFWIGWLLFVYACFILGIAGRTWKWPLSLSMGTLALTIALSIVQSQRYGLTVSVLSVGQGQCIVVRSQGETAVIDCGGNAGNAGRIATRYLRALGETRIDHLLLTHAHSDHVNGVADLQSLMPVTRTLLPETEDVLAQPPQFDYTLLTEPMTLTLGKASISLLPATWMEGVNEQCMAVIAEYGDFSFVTTGDLDMASERWLLRAASFPKHGAIVAGHHGSAGSSSEEWLSALEPQTVVVSVGRNNFGHPSPEAAERWIAAGAAVHDTRIDGNITLYVK